MGRTKPQDDSKPRSDEGRMDDHKWFLGVLIVIFLAAFGFLWTYICRVDEKTNGNANDLGKVEERINSINEKFENFRVDYKREAETIKNSLRPEPTFQNISASKSES